MSYLIVSPAYGRDYKNQESVLADWNMGKDFIVETFNDPYCGKLCNKQDIERTNYDRVQIRYAKMTKFVMVEVKS